MSPGSESVLQAQCLSVHHAWCLYVHGCLQAWRLSVHPGLPPSRMCLSSKQVVCPSRADPTVSCAPIPPLLHPHPPAPSQSLPALGQIHCPGTTRSTFLPPAQKLSSCCTSHQHSLMPEGNSPEIQSCTPSTEAANTTPQCKLIEVPSDFIHKTGETSESHALGRTERLAKHMLK